MTHTLKDQIKALRPAAPGGKKDPRPVPSLQQGDIAEEVAKTSPAHEAYRKREPLRSGASRKQDNYSELKRKNALLQERLDRMWDLVLRLSKENTPREPETADTAENISLPAKPAAYTARA